MHPKILPARGLKRVSRVFRLSFGQAEYSTFRTSTTTDTARAQPAKFSVNAITTLFEPARHCGILADYMRCANVPAHNHQQPNRSQRTRMYAPPQAQVFRVSEKSRCQRARTRVQPAPRAPSRRVQVGCAGRAPGDRVVRRCQIARSNTARLPGAPMKTRIHSRRGLGHPMRKSWRP